MPAFSAGADRQCSLFFTINPVSLHNHTELLYTKDI